MKKHLIMLSIICAVVFSGGAYAQEKRFEICSGAFGGTAFQCGFAISEIIKKINPEYEILPVETSGSHGTYMRAVSSPERMLISAAVTPFREAIIGKSPYPKAYPNLKLIGFMTSNVQTLVTYDPEIQSVEDMAGKRIGLRVRNTTTGKYLWSVIKHGIPDSEKNEPMYMNWGALQSGMMDGSLDVCAMGVAVNPNGPWKPVSIYMEMVASRGAPRFLSVKQEWLDAAGKEDGMIYPPLVIPRGAIAENVPDRDVLAWEERIGIFGFSETPDELAYDIARILCDNQKEITAITPIGLLMSREITVPGSDMPDEQIHPGALKYYKEKGLR